MKIKIGLLLILLVTLVSCQQHKSPDSTKIKKGMIKVAILYPNGEDKTFDMDYYSNKHMPMAANLFGESLKAMSIDKGIANDAPDVPVKYVAIGYFFFEDLSSFQNAMGPNQAEIKADVPNYTNIQPIVQISEVQTVE